MDERFDVVAVGSGFGASVAACRLAQAGRSVLVLERGRLYPPGSFPRSPRGLSQNLWDPKSGLYGMFDIWAFRGMESVVSSGVGGGSLIYANVLLRKDPGWFQEDTPGEAPWPWPVQYYDLEAHYEAAEAMLGAQQFPLDAVPYSATSKTQAMKEAAASLDWDWILPHLAVSFANPGRPPVPGEPLVEPHPNLHRLPRRTCILCGDCDVGCNIGAKNTLDYTYLSRAQDAGAVIRHLSEVISFAPSPDGGYKIRYWEHPPDAGTSAGHMRSVEASKLVVGAGTFGSTYLMLRNHSAFPRLSPALGTRFSGNGDLLTFLRRATQMVEGVAVPRPLDPELGPVITSAIRMPDSLDGEGASGRGFYIEDGGNPHFVDWVMQAGSALSVAGRGLHFAGRRWWAHRRGSPQSNISRDVSGLLGGGVPAANTVPMLCMGRDVPNGNLSLRGGKLDLHCNTSASMAYFDRVERTMGVLAAALGARVANTPLWLFKRFITVHPIGGLPMGHGPGDGVVDSYGEVFGYPGLHVLDGSILPGPVGANPSLTIAAVAERAAAHIANGSPPAFRPSPAGKAPQP